MAAAGRPQPFTESPSGEESRSESANPDEATLRAAAQALQRGAWLRTARREGWHRAPGAASASGIFLILACLAAGGRVSLPGPRGLFRGGSSLPHAAERERALVAPQEQSGMENGAMRSMQLRALAAGLSFGAAASGSAQTATEWRVSDGGNGHFYAVYAVIPSTQTWSAALASAEAIGGTLAGFQSGAERLWCTQLAVNASTVWRSVTINGSTNKLGPWIGGYQNPGSSEPLGGWFWTEGGAADVAGTGYSLNNWNCSPGVYEDRLCLFSNGSTPSVSSVVVNDQPERGYCDSADWKIPGFIVEWSADCNGDGIVDYGQILAGELDDTNGNNVPDCCEQGSSCPGLVAINGGFEAGTPLGACTSETVASGSALGTGWMVAAGSVQRVRASAACNAQGAPRFGDFFVDLLDAGEIRQAIATTPGRSYRLTFWLSGDCAAAPATKRVTASLGSVTQTFDHVCVGNGAETWRAHSLEFIASSALTTLSLKSAAGGASNGPLVDGVRVEDISISCAGDVDGDGSVTGGDIGLVLLNFGQCPGN